MNICGVLVHAHPERIEALIAEIGAVPGAEYHGRGDAGRLVVTVEDSPDMSAADALSELNKLPGVIAAALVYHEIDPEQEPQRGRTLS